MANFYSKLTPIGRAKVAAAIANESALQITHMALGDGAGNPVPPPTGDETILVREVYRDALNRLERIPNLEEFVEAEMLVEAQYGGWVVREIGLIDIDGDLVVYGNYPNVYKALPAEGTAIDLGFRTTIQVATDADVTLILDPNIITATRQWVSNLVIGSLSFLAGGTTNQLVRKRSNADYDVEWFSPDADELNITFDTIEEEQQLAAGQTVVNLATVTTTGTGIYVEGLRLYPGTHYTINSDTQITLHQSYPEDSQLLAVQNDPHSGINDADENTRGLIRLASQPEAVAGAENTKAMTSLRTNQQVTARIVDQPIAEAGSNNTGLMTPLRTYQQVTARIADSAAMIAGTSDSLLASPAGVKAKLDQFGINPTDMINPHGSTSPSFADLNNLRNSGNYYVYSTPGTLGGRYLNGPVLPDNQDPSLGTSYAIVEVRRQGSVIYQRFNLLASGLSAHQITVACRISNTNGNSWDAWQFPEEALATANRLLGTTGYLRLAGGLIAQWGQNSVAQNSQVNVTLPFTYQSEHLQAFASNGAGPAQVRRSGALPENNSSVRLINSDTTTIAIRWLSIGF